MYIFCLIYIFIGLINYIYSFVHITLYVLCDDTCSNIYLDEELLNLNEFNFDTTLNFRFQKINFYADPGQKITIIDQNNSGNFGIAAKIIIQSNDYYIYDTTNNLDMFSSTITHEINCKIINKCYVQTFIDICNELGCVVGSNDYSSYQYKSIEFYFTIPTELNHEILYENNNLDLILSSSNNININLNNFFNPTIPDDDENYIGVYYTKYNGIDIKGKFYDKNGNEIALETIYYDKKLNYVSNEDYIDMYNEIIYYEFSHGEYFEEDNSKKYLNILYCPNYCDYCTSEKLCIKSISYSSVLNNLKVDANNIISTRNLNRLTDNFTFLIFSINNKMDLMDSKLDIIGLNNCLNSLKSNTDYDSEYDYIISAYFNENNLIEFNVYDQEGNIVDISNDCKCYENCLTCDGNNYNECTSCEPPYTLTSQKTCINLGEICGNTSLLWYFNYDDNKIECISGYHCQNKTSKFIVETFECLPDCDNYFFSDKYKCIGCENENFIQIYEYCVNKYDINEMSNIISKYIKYFVNNSFSEGNSTYQIGYYQMTEKNNLTSIDLGDCADKLKTYYHTNLLIVLIIDTINDTSIINNVKYNVYSSDGKLLDLDICDSNEITIITPITNTSNINYDLAKNFKR